MFPFNLNMNTASSTLATKQRKKLIARFNALPLVFNRWCKIPFTQKTSLISQI